MYIRYSTPLYYAEIIQNHIKHLYKFSSNNFVYFWENNNACVQIPLYMRWMGGCMLVVSTVVLLVCLFNNYSLLLHFIQIINTEHVRWEVAE